MLGSLKQSHTCLQDEQEEIGMLVHKLVDRNLDLPLTGSPPRQHASPSPSAKDSPSLALLERDCGRPQRADGEACARRPQDGRECMRPRDITRAHEAHCRGDRGGAAARGLVASAWWRQQRRHGGV